MVVSDDFPIGYNLTGISAVENVSFGGDEIQLEEVTLFFEEVKKIIKLCPLVDTDETKIIQRTVVNFPPSIDTPLWGEAFVGKQLQAIWVCDNDQGYQDMVIFAFEWLRPSLTFITEASVLLVMSQTPIKREKPQH